MWAWSPDVAAGSIKNMPSAPNDFASSEQIFQARIHIEATSLIDAISQVPALIELLERRLPVRGCSVERYWKIPEHYVVDLSIGDGDTCESDWTELRLLFASDWELGTNAEEPSGIWDGHFHGSSAFPSARWAHFQIFAKQPS